MRFEAPELNLFFCLGQRGRFSILASRAERFEKAGIHQVTSNAALLLMSEVALDYRRNSSASPAKASPDYQRSACRTAARRRARRQNRSVFRRRLEPGLTMLLREVRSRGSERRETPLPSRFEAIAEPRKPPDWTYRLLA